MTKQENIFRLYEELGFSGQRGDFAFYVAGLCGVKKVTVKGHWLQNKEFPDHITEEQLDSMITYLQNAVASQNKVAV